MRGASRLDMSCAQRCRCANPSSNHWSTSCRSGLWPLTSTSIHVYALYLSLRVSHNLQIASTHPHRAFWHLYVSYESIEWVDFQSCCSINKKYTKPFVKTKCSPQMSYLNCECLNDILLLVDFNNIMHAVSSRKSLLPCSDLRPRQALLEKVHPLWLQPAHQTGHSRDHSLQVSVWMHVNSSLQPFIILYDLRFQLIMPLFSLSCTILFYTDGVFKYVMFSIT